MGRIVVDELVVALRLDDSQFDKAVAEAIAARQKLADETGKSEAKESSAITGMAKRYLSLYAVLKLVGSAYQELLNVSDGLLQLSNESRRLGMAAHGLRTWQNAFEMLGGSAGDATGEIDKFTNSLNALIFKGDVGENLQWLNRLGITPERGMTYDETAKRVFTGIQQGLASGSIKDRQEAGFIARQAGFSGVGDYITQNPNAGIADFLSFLGVAQSRAAGNATTNTGAAVGRNTIRNAQELKLTKEGVVAERSSEIMKATNLATDIQQGAWRVGSMFVEAATLIINPSKLNDMIQQNRPDGGFRGSPEYMRRHPEFSNAPPTPGIVGGSSSSNTTIIHQKNEIRSTDPVRAGAEVAERTRKAVNAQADGAGR